MSAAWLVVVAVGAATFALKSVGPVVLGGRPLPQPVARIVELLAPAVLAALVVTQTFGDGRGITVDERVVGVAAAGIALWLRAPLLLVVAVAAAATALARLVV